MPPKPAAFQNLQLLAFLSAFALLIGNTAAGLASRLAGSLTFAATAILRTVTQVASLNGFYVFHNNNLHKIFVLMLPYYCNEVKTGLSYYDCITSYLKAKAPIPLLLQRLQVATFAMELLP